MHQPVQRPIHVWLERERAARADHQPRQTGRMLLRRRKAAHGLLHDAARGRGPAARRGRGLRGVPQAENGGGDGDAADTNSILSSEGAASERASSSVAAVVCGGGSAVTACASSSTADVDNDLEKEALTCYNAAAAAACGSDDQADTIIVQSVPMLVQIPGTLSTFSSISRLSRLIQGGRSRRSPG